MDTWWQTETGGHMITPLPGVTPLKPGSCQTPLPGIMADIVDETGHTVEKGKGGILVIKRPWPAMIRTIWGDPERFKKSYYPEDFKGKYYLAGDGASRDLNGYYHDHGAHRRRAERLRPPPRHDGGRIGAGRQSARRRGGGRGPAGRPDGRGGVAFVVTEGPRPAGEEGKKVARELRDWVAKEIGPIAKPKDIRFGDNLPKTRSGKIMRRLLRSIAKGEEITQDVSTLENPGILEQLKQAQ